MSYQTERQRLRDDAEGKAPWRRWGPYLSERQWGTVREDYSASGDAWNSFTHEQSRSRAYRWGEDGMLGFSDDRSYLCFAPAVWNGADPILKERMFGLSNPEGNHGEDVKECFYYLDATPTHSYLKALYKYPQRPFPYDWLLSENRRRSRQEPEFEILDTDAFDQGRYFDVFMEYAKQSPEDIWIRISAINRGPDPAPIHVLPTLWFRNTWSWTGEEQSLAKPSLKATAQSVTAEHSRLGRFLLLADPASPAADRGPEWLFCENETNNAKLWGGANSTPWPKDSFHEYVIGGRKDAVNPAGHGTKAAAHYHAMLAPGETLEIRLRLCREDLVGSASFEPFDGIFARCREDADAFYHGMARPQEAQVFRQASASLIWSKQFYYYKVKDWLRGDPLLAPPAGHVQGRNHDWKHVFSQDVIAMPDKWEFPWFATWDLAFHTIPYIVLDPDFGKDQAILVMREWYMHPNGQLPAYEYDFGDVNPPVLAMACRLLYQVHAHPGERDFHFLRRVYPKLLLNFTWWVNRKDARGKNLFSGGFLGLDNIGVFNRSMTLPPGVVLEQADGTAWMGLFCTEMLALSLEELASQDAAWEDMAVKFFEHFADIERSLNGADGLWDETDGFYYDFLRAPGHDIPLKVRSIVGVLPLLAFGVLEDEKLTGLNEFAARGQWFVRNNPAVKERFFEHTRIGADGKPVKRYMAALASRNQLERVLRYLFDESEFLSEHGIRSVSKIHESRPYAIDIAGQHLEVGYLPGESDNTMFGGNSNWRGPIWMPINFMIVEALRRYYVFYGDDLMVEFPTGSGNRVNLDQAADALSERLLGIFKPNPEGYRPCHGAYERYARDPHWKDLILFNEYFHGDSGRGCGASHQTGWTALVSTLAFQMEWKAQHRKSLEEIEAMAHRET